MTDRHDKNTLSPAGGESRVRGLRLSRSTRQQGDDNTAALANAVKRRNEIEQQIKALTREREDIDSFMRMYRKLTTQGKDQP